jgi:thiol:disulfide interchange protein DsbA
MSRRLTIAMLILLPLAACGRSEAPTTASVTDDASTTSAAPASVTSVANAQSPAPASTATVASASSTAAAAASPATVTLASGANVADSAPAAPSLADPNAPRLGTDYEILPTPQPTWGQGKIEVAEVFSYACIHCAQFQPTVDIWLKKLPKDVRYEYVPAVFAQVWENFARAYFAAKVLGVQERTHDAIFKAVHIDHTVKSPSPEGIADWYATQGVDRTKFLDTMNSFGVTAMVNRAKQFALRTGIDGTPTIIVAGKYKVNVNADRGFDGMLATVDYLLARERTLSTTTPAAAGKP